MMENEIKKIYPNTIIIMSGYHSMRKPEETINNSGTDIVLLSNHVDFVLNSLVNEISKKGKELNYDFITSGIAYKKNNGKDYIIQLRIEEEYVQ